MVHKLQEPTLNRRLSVFDMDEFARHLLRLDPEGRRLRFGSIVTDAFLKDYAQRSSRWDVILYGHFVSGTLHGVAEMRPIAGTSVREAELAFSIEREWRGRGIGSLLFSRLMRAARNRGYRKLHMSCLSTNEPMQALARKFAAKISFEQGGATGIIDPGHLSPASLLAEAADEASTFVFATISLPRWNPLGLFRRESHQA